MNTHIKTQENIEKGYIKVWCDEGHYITNWDKVDIYYFTDAKVMYCPLNVDLSAYYCISDEEHQKYIEDLEKAIKMKDEENKNKLNKAE